MATNPLAPTAGGVQLTSAGQGQVKPLNPDANLKGVLANLISQYSSQPDYSGQISDLTKAYQNYANTLNSQPTALQQYQTYSTQLGIPQAQQNVNDIGTQISNTEKMLSDLEGNINQRIQGLPGVTESLRQRYLATEQKPLTQQLADLGIAQQGANATLSTAQNTLANMMTQAGIDRQTQQTIAQLPVQQQQAIQSLLSQQQGSQQQQYANMLSAYSALKPTTQAVGAGQTIIDPDTGQPIYQSPITPSSGYKVIRGGLFDEMSNTWIIPPTSGSADLNQGVLDMKSQLESPKVRGKDGYISPEDWNTALEAWVNEGLKVADFKTNFKYLANPNDKQDYGL